MSVVRRPTDLVFELPLPDNITNGPVGNWRTKYFGRKAYWDKLDALVTLKKNPRPVAGMPWIKTTAEIQMRTLREMDQGNAHFRATKWPFDWLERRGYVKNDRHIKYTLDPCVAKRAHLGITIVLREAA